jgi:hypothetical protein
MAVPRTPTTLGNDFAALQEPEAAKPSSVPFVETQLEGENLVHMESAKVLARGIEEAERPISAHSTPVWASCYSAALCTFP